MRTTGVVTDPRFREHVAGPGHPECPERLEAIERVLAAAPYDTLPRIPARVATEQEVERVHTADVLRAVAASATRPHTRFDPDTAASAGSFEAARLAAGAAVDLVDAVLAGDVANGFAALRPPGHHAERDRVMGFCLFNNVAIAARHLTTVRGLERVLILDWDVHHGNGTQHTFYGSREVMYSSLHQYPFYPGTGAVDEVGRGDAEGYTVNLPMQAGWGEPAYMGAFRDVILPIARQFAPQFVLVSAGFDAHRADPLASMRLDTASYGRMTDAIVQLADECCAGRLVMLLEGGYSLEALQASVQTVLEHLSEPRPFPADDGELTSWGEVARSTLERYWKI